MLSASQYTTKTLQTKTWMIIVNPAAGAGAVQRLWPKIKQELENQKIQFEYLYSEYEKHILTLIAKAIKTGYTKFIGVGGDGTINEVLNGIFNNSGALSTSNFVIGVIPCGTGNDWIKTHKIKNDIKDAIDCIKNNDTILHDVGSLIIGKDGPKSLSANYFLNIAGIGFNASVIENTQTLSKKLFKSKYNYIFALIISLFKFKPPKLILTIDDKQIDNCYFTVNAGICQYNGGGMKIVPHAIYDDGKLSLTIVENITKWKVISNFFNLFDGSFVKKKEVSTFNANRLSIGAQFPFGVEMDGELLGNTTFVTIKNITKAIQVISTSEA